MGISLHLDLLYSKSGGGVVIFVPLEVYYTDI